MLYESVFRALPGRSSGRARYGSPLPALCWALWGWTGFRKSIRSAAKAARHVAPRTEHAAVCYVDGHVRAYQGTGRFAKTDVRG